MRNVNQVVIMKISPTVKRLLWNFFSLPVGFVPIGVLGTAFPFFRAILTSTSNYNGFEVLVIDSILLIIFYFWWLMIIRLGDDTYWYPSSKNFLRCRLLMKNTDGGIWLN